jgi:hypothetical protein
VFGAFLLVLLQPFGVCFVFRIAGAAWQCPCDRPVFDLASRTRTSIPETIRRSSFPAFFKKYMYGDGFTMRSAR